MADSSGKHCRLSPRRFWLSLIGISAGLLIWWLLRWYFLPCDGRTSGLIIDAPRSEGKRPAIKKDDFRILKGIGPISAAALYQAGIFSFEQLGLMSLDNLVLILKEHNLPSGKAAFWQKQAILAAAENWKDLEKLQK